jgi:hypothetical protein
VQQRAFQRGDDEIPVVGEGQAFRALVLPDAALAGVRPVLGGTVSSELNRPSR